VARAVRTLVGPKRLVGDDDHARPEGTRSHAATMYAPDTPTAPDSGPGPWPTSPVTVTELPEDVGDDTGSGHSVGAFQVPDDARTGRFIGAAPPAGHSAHRYALAAATTGMPADFVLALLRFTMAPPHPRPRGPDRDRRATRPTTAAGTRRAANGSHRGGGSWHGSPMTPRSGGLR
jgi:hypothetical protein